MRRGYPDDLSRRTVLTGIASVALSQSRELSSNGKMVLPAGDHHPCRTQKSIDSATSAYQYKNKRLPSPELSPLF